MEKDTYKTKVIFRVWKKEPKTVIAFFPEIHEGNYCILSYEHLGQHGGAKYFGLISETRLAKPEEYKDLFSELELIGYNLKVLKKAKIRW